MITNKRELKKYIEIEKNIYKNLGYKNFLLSKITNSEVGYIYDYVRLLRYDEYFENKTKNIFLFKLIQLFIRRRRNKIGIKLGINIPINTCGIGITIYHSNGIIINSKSVIGKYCKFHGDNCIGNDGIDDNVLPKIGDNVDIGIGAKIIGNVLIGDNCKVGANAVVLKGKFKDNSVLVGIPAKNIRED